MSDYNTSEGQVEDNIPRLERKFFFKRARFCPLEKVPNSDINFKNTKLLSKYTSERGRFTPRRITSVSASKQRVLNTAIKYARHLALLPFLK